VSRPLVVIDADVLGRQRTGDETHLANLLRELTALAPELRLAAVTRRPEEVPPGVEALALSAGSKTFRMAVTLPRLLHRTRPALAHFFHAAPPLFRGRFVLTVQDLSFERHPELMARKDRTLFRTFVPRSARRADRVLTGSEQTKHDLVELYRLPDERIVVTPYGVDAAFAPGGRPADDPPYALVVGALQPRKDPLTAIRALALAPRDLRLVFVGPEKQGADEVRAAAVRLGLAPRISFRGHVEKDELVRLYRSAACLVFPSLYEGFGFPALEAMACGTPVVASTAGALPEVVSDAGILVAPRDPVALARGIERALAERERLVGLGLARARRFSWTETARRTLAVYRELL
jgi:glycosyltransferase involved in cell wall biosynthesis